MNYMINIAQFNSRRTMMNAIKQWMTQNRLSRTILAGLLGLLLVLNVACSAPKASTPAAEDIYSQGTQGNRGAMTDRDQSLDENNPRTKAKTRELIDTAKKNAANPNKLEDLSEQARQTVEDIPGEVSDRVKSQKDDLVKGTERGMRNLKENLKAASKEIPDVVKEATDGAKAKLK
jgi:gas vesicle protein